MIKKYRCKRCEEIFETEGKHYRSTTTLKICPKCRKPKYNNKGTHLTNPEERLRAGRGE